MTKEKKKRRNRGRNKDGELISIFGASSSLMILITWLLSKKSESILHLYANYTGIGLAIFGIYGYYMQKKNRMTSNTIKGFYGNLIMLGSHLGIVIAFMIFM